MCTHDEFKQIKFFISHTGGWPSYQDLPANSIVYSETNPYSDGIFLSEWKITFLGTCYSSSRRKPLLTHKGLRSANCFAYSLQLQRANSHHAHCFAEATVFQRLCCFVYYRSWKLELRRCFFRHGPTTEQVFVIDFDNFSTYASRGEGD